MKTQDIFKYIVIISCVISTACIEVEYIQERPCQTESQNLSHSPEMQNLRNFLNEDITNEQDYHLDLHRGVDYYVCSGYTRDLAKNASEYGIKMGGISLRDTMTVGAGTRYHHAMNYCIIDGQFLAIEPQSDKIYTLESLKNYRDGVYKYITIFPNAQIMTNFGKHKETINIYLQGDYNESEIIKKFPPDTTYKYYTV